MSKVELLKESQILYILILVIVGKVKSSVCLDLIKNRWNCKLLL